MTTHDPDRSRTGLTLLDRRELLKDASRLLAMPARRRFLRSGVTLGSLAAMTGCSVTDSKTAESMLMAVSRFNDRVQAWLFDPNRLAPTYPESMITRPFPFNAYYGIDRVAERGCLGLPAAGERPRAAVGLLDAGAAGGAAAAGADHAPYLRGGLERDRAMGRGAVLDISWRGSAPT